MQDRRWRLSLVLPAYNEESGIRQAVREACAALDELTASYEILVVDDGSTDGTAAAVEALAAERPQVRLLRHERNRGYGAALRTGFAAASFERVAFTDADCQFHLEDLGRLLSLSDRYHLVVGWRQGRQDSWQRRFLSRGYNLLARTLLGTRVRDCDCALKVFQREALAELLPETDTYFVNTEMLTRACQQGLAVAEVGVRHRPRLHGVSKVSLREVPRTLEALLPFWWSRVLFPSWRAGGGSPLLSPQQGADAPRSSVALGILVLMAALLFLLRLRAPLLEPQEPRYAEIPRQMLHEGRLLVPVLHGQDYLDKPPLLYWLVMGSYSLFGVHDWAARLVPGLAGILTVLVTYLWGRRVAGERVGLLGALMLCLSAGFIYRQRMLNMDSLLCLWVTTALASAHAALTHGPQLRRRWWLLAAAACGLGLLTKGPVMLVLVLTPLLIYARLETRCSRLRFRDWLVFVLLAVALAAPWYVAVMIRVPGFAREFFWRHHVERFLTPFDHAKPAWFYLPGLLAGMLPWTLLLPGFVRYLGRRSLRAAQRRPAALGFFLLSALWCLLFFSLSGCKRPAYILPAMPALALALGCYLNVLVLPGRSSSLGGLLSLWRRGSRLARQATLLVLVACLGVIAVAAFKQMVRPTVALLLETLALAALTAARNTEIRNPKSERNLKSLISNSKGTISSFVFRISRFFRLSDFGFRISVHSWAVCAAITFAALVLGVYHLQPAYNRQFALRGALRTASGRAGGGAPIVCYPQRWDSVSFYVPRAEVRVFTLEQRRQMMEDLRSRPRTLLLVKSGRVLDDLLRELPDSLEFVTHGRPGAITAGWVRPRPEPPSARYAQR